MNLTMTMLSYAKLCLPCSVCITTRHIKMHISAYRFSCIHHFFSFPIYRRGGTKTLPRARFKTRRGNFTTSLTRFSLASCGVHHFHSANKSVEVRKWAEHKRWWPQVMTIAPTCFRFALLWLKKKPHKNPKFFGTFFIWNSHMILYDMIQYNVTKLTILFHHPFT